VNTNTKNIVVRVATILQEIAFNRLLIGFSTHKHSFSVKHFIKHHRNVINLSIN